MKRRSALKTMAVLPVPAALYGASGTRTWVGPEFWANPLQDWHVRNERFECHTAGGDRNLYWLTREVRPGAGSFRMSVHLGSLASGIDKEPGFVGFRFGMRGHFHDYRDTALRGIGVDAGIASDGRLFIGTVQDGPALSSLNEVELILEGNGSTLRLSAGGKSVQRTLPPDQIHGGVALVCHSGALPNELPRRAEPTAANSGKLTQQRGGAMRFWFRDWTLTGPAVAAHPDRAWGPILFTQYTLTGGVLKMTVQLAPAEGGEPPVQLKVGDRVIESPVDAYSSTAVFRTTGHDSTRDAPFEISYLGSRYAGVIRRDPADRNQIVVGSLTCQGDFGFPHTEIARSVQQHNPDILFFTGDQLYEANGGYGIQREPAEAARLDYLRKWYLFGWAWGDLTRNTPCVCLPDDHDVYHGNIWGAGGRRAEYPADRNSPAYQQHGQDSGGYTMPARWVHLVHRTQSSHLPDSPHPGTVDQNIPVLYGRLLWGGIDFALLEDRKWKSAPKGLLKGANILNGWPQNPEWSSATSGDVPGAQLLGERQERFLAEWARDWPDPVEMKAVVSATIFCNLCTQPKDMMSDAGTPNLPVQPRGGYAEGEKFTQDHDSNGWPQTPRNRALRAMRSCLAVHLAGDQHLPSTLQYGIEEHNDASYVLCSPAISNIFPRRFYPPEPGANRKPGAPRYTGEYRDGFGNRMTVHAVANPQKFGVAPHALHERVPGYGIAVFDKRARSIRLTNYPRWSADPFPGWPITIQQTDNGLNGAKWELRLPEAAAGLVTVTSGDSNEPVLIWRTADAIDKVPLWDSGTYNVTIGSRRFGPVAAVRRT